MANVNLRVSDEQKEHLEGLADAAGLKLSDWMRERLGLSGPGAGTGVAQPAEHRGTTEAAGSSPAADESPPGPESPEQRWKREKVEQWTAEGACTKCGSLGHETEEHGKW